VPANSQVQRTKLVPFTVTIADLALSSTVETTADHFLFIANDASVDSLHLVFDQTSVLRGTWQASILMQLEDGAERTIFGPITIATPFATPREFRTQQGQLRHGRLVFLRVKSQPSGGTTPWWTVPSFFFGTFHMLTKD
jgi:hypothetical protein